jgi:hypothetical protein
MRCFLLSILLVFLLVTPAYADAVKPDDRIMFDVSAEDWVTTKTAHVTVAVEAAVNASTAGTMRADMMKAVNDLAKGDWRLTSFNRNQDQTGLERWSTIYEARLPEADLAGLGDNAKKLSKAGMQLSVANVDFSPTLEEMETARGVLRTQIYKITNEQLAALNTALPGRFYRIALINFTGEDESMPMPRVIKGRAGMMAAMSEEAPMAVASAMPPTPMERAQKVSMMARIIYATSPERPVPLPAPLEKH